MATGILWRWQVSLKAKTSLRHSPSSKSAARNEQVLSASIGYRLYLPVDWASAPQRRAKAGVPDDAQFKTKPQIALDRIRETLAAGVRQGVVLADAGYGNGMRFRCGLKERNLD